MGMDNWKKETIINWFLTEDFLEFKYKYQRRVIWLGAKLPKT